MHTHDANMFVCLCIVQPRERRSFDFSKKMTTTLKEAQLQNKLEYAGKNLLGFSSVASTTPLELQIFLDRLEKLLSEVGQTPSRSMKDALHPSMKALVSDQLLKHYDLNVKVSVASCMSELIRITSPDAPYDDIVQMKDIFNLIVMALAALSSEDAGCYDKGLRILGNMTIVKAEVLMVDLECRNLIPEMFRVFLSTIGYPHSNVVFKQMETIMTRIFEESEEISDELLSILLTSINNKKEHVYSRPWMLGEKVFSNCNVRLQHFLPKFVRSRNLNVADYASVVAYICLRAQRRTCMWNSWDKGFECLEKDREGESEVHDVVCSEVKAE